MHQTRRRILGSTHHTLLYGMAGLCVLLAVVAIVMVKGRRGSAASRSPAVEHKPEPKEKRFGKLIQLTFAGQNAEAYWSFAEDKLIFQSTRGKLKGDQIFTMDPDGRNVRMVSTGKGQTTCAYWLPKDERILFASTHATKERPMKHARDPRLGYTWSVWNAYAIYTANPDGSDIQLLTDSKGYDAEATVSPTGDRIVFTSSRDGDLDLYSMNLKGKDIKRLTTDPGYDGGAVFSWDGKRIAYRAPNRDDPDFDAEADAKLLKKQLVKPSKLELWIMDADGTNKQMITSNGAANFGPFWHPDHKHIIFSSNLHNPKQNNFELYLINVETLKIERVTYFERRRAGRPKHDDFDGFPMFTSDGKKLVFCSNRHNRQGNVTNETNVFVADWID